jgi:hypothetical protein
MSPESVRGLRGDGHEWLQHRIAVRHLDAIDELLRQMEAIDRNTTVFRRHYQSWGSLVIFSITPEGSDLGGRSDR